MKTIAIQIMACLSLAGCAETEGVNRNPDRGAGTFDSADVQAASVTHLSTEASAEIDLIAGPRQAGHAWWSWVRFRPTGTVVAGLPVSAIDSTWISASALDRSRMPSDASADPSSLADSAVDFQMDGDFNHDGVADRAIVGVFTDRVGKSGRFFLILSESEGIWTVAHLDQLTGQPAFQALKRSDQGLQVWYCFECDGVADVVWDGAKYNLVDCCDDKGDTSTVRMSGVEVRASERRSNGA